MIARSTLADAAPAPASTSRRSWLKGLGALVGGGLLAAPSAVLAAPTTSSAANAPLAAAAATGGDEYIGMIKLLPGTAVPTGWVLCEGQLLPIEQHPALFAMLRTTYGGDGRHTFALPDMRGDMAHMRALDAARPANAEPMGRLCVIKVANAPALATAGVALRLIHARRPRPAVA